MSAGHDVVLFWLVLAGLLLLDNFVIVPSGHDCLRFGRSGRLHYDAGLRLDAWHRELVFLNPLNPFDRIAVTDRCIGPVSAAELRAAHRAVRVTLQATNLLSRIGAGYLVVLVLLALSSFRVPFWQVMLGLIVAHGLAWGMALWVLVAHRGPLQLGGRLGSLAAEALFVPGYLVNLGKRVWFKRVLSLPALTLGLRRWQKLDDEGDIELQRHRLVHRLDEIAASLDAPSAPTTAQTWILEARTCLTSVPKVG